MGEFKIIFFHLGWFKIIFQPSLARGFFSSGYLCPVALAKDYLYPAA
jgi:hypothetical protein